MTITRLRIPRIHRPTWRIFLIVCVACVAAVTSYETFVPDEVSSSSLLNMVIDVQTGKVYLGAVNMLYQLSSDLRLEKSYETGPRDDNPMCPPPSSSCQCEGNNCKEFAKVLMDSVSKTLVIDYRGERLISCSNLFQVRSVFYSGYDWFVRLFQVWLVQVWLVYMFQVWLVYLFQVWFVYFFQVRLVHIFKIWPVDHLNLD